LLFIKNKHPEKPPPAIFKSL